MQAILINPPDSAETRRLGEVPMHPEMHNALIAQRRILEQGAALIEQGQLEILVNRIFPLEQAAAAHRLLGEGHTAGKIVLEI